MDKPFVSRIKYGIYEWPIDKVEHRGSGLFAIFKEKKGSRSLLRIGTYHPLEILPECPRMRELVIGRYLQFSLLPIITTELSVYWVGKERIVRIQRCGNPEEIYQHIEHYNH